MDGRRARSDLTRQRMLDAGVALLHGGMTGHELKATQICAAAGGSQSSFYNIFGSREQYLLALHDRLLDEAHDAVGRELWDVETPSNGSDLVERVVAALVRMVDEHGWSFRAFAPVERQDAAHACRRLDFDRRLVARIADVLADVVPGDECERRRTVAAWAVVTSVIRGATGRVPFLGHDPETRRAASDAMTRVIVSFVHSPLSVPRPIPSAIIPPFPTHPPTPRNKILDAAEELLVDHDSLDMRMLELNITSDVSVSTIYDEFGSKLGVIEAVLGRLLDDALEMADEVLVDDVLSSHEDLIDYLCHAYALLAAFMNERFHILGAFEAPGRLTDEISARLAAAEEQLIARGLDLSPHWDGHMEDVVLSIRMSKVVLQLIVGNDVDPIARLGVDRDELITELAVMTSARAVLGAETDSCR